MNSFTFDKQNRLETPLTVERSKMLSNVVELAQIATTEQKKYGANWYTEANTFAQKLSNESGLNLFQIAGIISAFSPLKDWGQNKDVTELFLNNPYSWEYLAEHEVKAGLKLSFGKCNKKAAEIALLNNPNYEDVERFFAPLSKTHNFFNAILLRCQAVTLDVHALNSLVWGLDGGKFGDKNAKHLGTFTQSVNSKKGRERYQYLSDIYKDALNVLGWEITPNDLQAVVWVSYRQNVRGLQPHK